MKGSDIAFTLYAKNPQGQDVWRKYEGKISSATELTGGVKLWRQVHGQFGRGEAEVIRVLAATH